MPKKGTTHERAPLGDPNDPESLRGLGTLALVRPTSYVADLVYSWVAANRQRLPGGTPACAL